MVIDIATISSKNTSPVKTAKVCCPAVSEAPLNRSNATRLAAAFAALGDPVRLRLFSLIAACGDAETCACALVKPTGRSQPTVSHHLKVLREAGLITSTKRGTWVWYRVDPQRLAELQSILG
jgi:ArsR family transcriptional regulator